MGDLCAFASALPNVSQGVACAGTALESRTFSTNKKSFLFVSKKDVRLKLGDSRAQALASGYAVGTNGWVKIPAGELPPTATMKEWVKESHALMSPTARKPAASTRRGKRPTDR